MSASAPAKKLRLSYGFVFAGVLSGCVACSSSDKPSSGGAAGALSNGGAKAGEAGSATAGVGGVAAGAAGGGGVASGAAGNATAGSGGRAGSTGDSGAPGLPTGPTTDYGADDPNILYSGRIDFTNATAPVFSAPGVTIRAAFHGNSLAIKVKDSKESGNPNYFDVLVDDKPAVKIKPTLLATSYPVAIQLADTDHTVTVTKRTEASIGFTSFLGFTFGGHILPPPPALTRKIEVIGDSITAGAGMEAINGSAQCNDTYGEAYQNAYLSYGAVAARALNAEYHITGVSGIGLVQNYSQGYDGRPMPLVYDLMYVEQNGALGTPAYTMQLGAGVKTSPVWMTSNFVPDAVVIALGTNDFSPGDGNNPDRKKLVPADYAVTYEAFIEQLRGYYPDAHYFCLTSPILGDGFPTAAETYATDLKTAIAAVGAHYSGLSDAKVHALVIDKVSGNGCGGHPDVAQQALAAKQLQLAISTALGW